jgi:hypothetical protein
MIDSIEIICIGLFYLHVQQKAAKILMTVCAAVDVRTGASL